MSSRAIFYIMWLLPLVAMFRWVTSALLVSIWNPVEKYIPGGFATWLLDFAHFWEKVIGFVEHRGQRNFARTHLCARRTFLSTVYICAKLCTSFLIGSVICRIPSNGNSRVIFLASIRCVLFGMGACMAIPSALKIRLWPTELDFQFESWGRKSHAMQTILIHWAP